MNRNVLAWIAVAALPFTALAAPPESKEGASLKARLRALEARVAALEARGAACEQLAPLANYVTVEPGELNGVKGPHVLFTGVNVHVRSGVPATYQDGLRGAPLGPSDGLGNLIVGWNEVRDPNQNEGTLASDDRYGSNNLVVGYGHVFKGDGGFVAGWLNHLPFRRAASVAGGLWNTASGWAASVAGGYGNEATNNGASVSGGNWNVASGEYSSVTGGRLNEASQYAAAVCGGSYNAASAQDASVSGGTHNTASGNASSVSGGVGLSVVEANGYAP